MNSSDEHRDSLLNAAKHGDDEALGELIDGFRPGLRAEAGRSIAGGVQGRVSPSDIVQNTWLSAFRRFPDFDGDLAGFRAWLRKIHEANIKDAIRDQHAARRDVAREQSGTAALPAAQARITSPSQKAMRREQNEELLAAIAQLPPAQREAVRLRYFEQLPVADITSRLGRSETAVAGLLKRGISRLRLLMQERGGTET